MIQKLSTNLGANCWHNNEKQKKTLDSPHFCHPGRDVWPVCMDLHPRNSWSGAYPTQCRLFGTSDNRVCHLF